VEVEVRTILSILPEITLAVVAVAVMVGGAFVSSRTGWITVSVTALIAAGIVLFRQYGPPFSNPEVLATGTFTIDTLAGTLRWFGLGSGLLFTLMIARRAGQDADGELLGMLLLIVAGVMLVTSASDVITMFLALELISIPTYVILFLGRGGRRSAEATAKYFYLSVLSSSFFLMGLALIYGITGSTSLVGIGESFAAETTVVRPALLALILIVGSLGFKIAAVPFHFYAPDVYLATTNVNAGLLSVMPKIAGLLAIVRLTTLFVPLFPAFSWQLIIVISILTMTIGNVSALLQNNVRRMMAYSSIAHAGYMLIGVAVGLFDSDDAMVYGGFAAAFLYLCIYALASIGTFAALSEVEDDSTSTGSVASLAGLAYRRPWMAGVIGICMFSLAGLPPLAGFWGKLTLFSAALTAYRSGPEGRMFLGLAVIGAVNAAIAAAYYLRIVGTMYFSWETDEETSPLGIGAVAAAICGVVIIVAGLFPGPMIDHFRHVQPTRQNMESVSRRGLPSGLVTEEKLAALEPTVMAPVASHATPRLP
jgi:NADH-quinone oxidoreductase subunit N